MSTHFSLRRTYSDGEWNQPLGETPSDGNWNECAPCTTISSYQPLSETYGTVSLTAVSLQWASVACMWAALQEPESVFIGASGAMVVHGQTIIRSCCSHVRDVRDVWSALEVIGEL